MKGSIGTPQKVNVLVAESFFCPPSNKKGTIRPN